MHLNRWKSVLVSWANALEIVPTTLNFVGDLSPEFFVKLCSFLKRTDVSTLQEAVEYISGYYQSLILGYEDDENYVALLATVYLLFTSVHKTNDELCKRLSSVSNYEQAAIKSALEAFIDIQPPKLTKDLIFMTLAQLPDGPESCGNSPYLTSSGSATPAKESGTPVQTSRRSSRFKRVKHQLNMTLTLKNSLQEELDSARETISNLESVLHVKNQDISQLKERCQRLLKDREEIKGRESPNCISPPGGKRDCGKCRALERQVFTYQENTLLNQSNIEELNESLESLNKKIVKLEMEKRSMDDQLRLYEEQIMKNNDDISILQFQREEAVKNNKELTCIIEELREAKLEADRSMDASMPENLGNEVIDLQLCELRSTLDEKIEVIHERDASINRMQSDIARLTREYEMTSAQFVEAQKINTSVEQQLRDSQQHCTSLTDKVAKQKELLKELEHSNQEQDMELKKKNDKLSTLVEEIDQLRAVIQQEQKLKEILSHEMEVEKSKYEISCRELQEVVSMKDSNISSLENEIKCLTETLKQEVAAVEDLRKEVKTLQLTLAEGRTEIAVLEDTILKNTLVMQEMQLDKESCSVRILELQNAVEKLSEECKQSSTELVFTQNLKKNLEKELMESQQCIAKLSEDLEKRGVELMQLRSSFGEQEKVLSDKNGILSSLLEVVQQLQESNEMLSQKIETREDEYQEISNQLKNEVATLKKKFGNEIERLKKLWKQEEDENACLKKECGSLKSTLTERSAKLTVLEREISENQSMIQEILRDKELLRDSLLESQNEIQNLTEKYQLTSAQLDDERKMKKDIEQQLRQSEIHVKTLTEHQEELENEVQKLKCSYAEQEKLLIAKNEELTSSTDEVAQLTADVQKEQQSNKMLSQKVETHKSEYERICIQLEKSVAEQNEKTRKFEEEAKCLTQSWNQEKKTNASLRVECESLQSSLIEKSAVIDALRKEIARNESVIQEKIGNEELLNVKILDVQNEIQKSINENQLISAQLAAEQSTKKDLEQQLLQSQLQILTLSGDRENQRNEMEKLECLLAEQEAELTAKNEELSSLKNEVAQLAVAVQEEQNSNEVLSEQVKMQKSDYEKICNDLEKAVAKQNEMTRTFEDEAKCLTESWNQEKDINTSLKRECESLQSLLTEKNEKVDALEVEISRNQSVIRAKQENEELLSARILDLMNEIRNSIEENQLTSAQLADEQKTKNAVELQLQQSQLRITSLVEDQEKQANEMEKLKCSYVEQEELLKAKNEELSTFKNEVTQLSSDIQQERRSNEVLSQQIESHKSDYERICNNLEKVVAERNEMTCTFEEKVKRLTESWNQEKVANDSLKKECESLQSSLTEKSSKIAALEGEISRNQSVIKESLEKEESLNAKMLDMQNEIRRSVDECQLISMQLADEQKIKKDVEQTLQQSQLLVATLSDDQKKQGNEVQKLKSFVAEQEEVLIAKNEEVTSLTNEVTQLTSAIQQEQRSNEALSKQIESLKSDNEKICNQLEKTVANQNETTRKFEEEAKCLTESWNHEKKTNASLRVENESLQSSLTEKSSKIDALEDEISRNKLEVQEKQEKEELLNKRIVDMQNEIQKSVKECQLISAQLADEQTMKKEVEQQLQQNQLRISKLSDDLTALETLHKEQEEMLAVKTERLSSLESQFAQLEAVKKDIEEDNLKCKETIQTLEADLLKYSQSNEVTDAKLMKILEQKNVVEERLAILEKELEVAGNSTNAKEKEYELEKANTQTVISSLQGEVERLTNDNLSAKSRISSLDQEVDNLNRRLLNSSMDLDIKNETVLMMQTTISSLNSKVDQLEAETKSKDCALATAIANLQETKTEFEKYREEIKRTTDKRLEEGAAAVRRKDDELVNLLRKNETLNERIAFLSEELLQVSQTFNSEKTSLMDHAKNLEEMLESARTTEERLSDEIVTLKDQLRLKELKLSRNDEKMSLSQELHSIEKREWVNKNTSLQSQLDENKIKCDRLMKELEEANVEQLIGKISRLEAESQELRDKLELKLKDVQWYAHELEVLQKSASNTMKVNQQLEEEVEFLTKSKLKEVTRLEKEIATLSQNSKQLGTDHASDISAKLRQEYEDKLERLKAKMRKIYTEKMEKMMKYQTGDEKIYADEELRKEKQKRHALESRVRELSDQLLIVQEEKRKLVSNNGFLTPVYRVGGGPIANPAYESPPIHKSHSLDRLSVAGSYGLDNLGADHLDQSFNKNGNLDRSFGSRRTSTSSNRSSHLPKGIGKVFPAAEEDGEVFDNRCLSDLKDGVCRLPGPGGMDDRMSILQQRNSMCPPHLKSSYPVESQFFATNAKEDEIKLQVHAKSNKENQPDARSVPGTPSKLRSLFSGARRKH